MSNDIIEEVEPLRVCRECGKEAFTTEHLNLFSTNKSMKHGVGTICKKCDSKKFSKYHSKNYVKVGNGFKSNAKSTLYFVKIETQYKETFYKIGVTNRTVQERFKIEPEVKITSIFELEVKGDIALRLERDIKNNPDYEKFKVEPNYKVLKYTGNTEIFTENIFKS